MSFSPLLTMITALAFVLGLMGLLYIFMKKLGLAGPPRVAATPQKTGGPGTTSSFWVRLAGQTITPSAPKRLSVIETLPLTAQHRAIILRMDDTDHLVIIGPNGQSVGITKVPQHDSSP